MNTLSKQFSDALKREGKPITTYYKNKTVTCLFRKNSDGNNNDNHVTIFYEISAPIYKGELITYNTKKYLVLNQETGENSVYYKSALIECNLLIPVTINSVVTNIPCYSYDLGSAYTVSNDVISIVDGKGEIITELIPTLSTTGYLNTGLRIMGGYYIVSNMYNLDGIVHLMIERDAMPVDVYALDMTAEETTYKVNETAQISAVTTLNGLTVSGQTITYSSSDTSLATVDANGLITFVAVGTVTITGTWTEQNKTDTLSIVITEADIPVTNYTMTIAASGELLVGGSLARTFTPKLVNSEGVEQTFTVAWTFNYNTMPTSDFTITYDGNKCKIKVAEDYEIIDKILVLTCTTSDGTASAIYNATIGA